jgi:hypothetical protein
VFDYILLTILVVFDYILLTILVLFDYILLTILVNVTSSEKPAIQKKA